MDEKIIILDSEDTLYLLAGMLLGYGLTETIPKAQKILDVLREKSSQSETVEPDKTEDGQVAGQEA